MPPPLYERLQATVAELKDIGQGRSGFAAKVFLTLANEVKPSKLDRKNSADTKRMEAAAYADQALSALESLGHEKSEIYTSALFAKAVALEDAEEYPEAAEAYDAAIQIYKTLPNHSKDLLDNASTRLSIVRSQMKGGKKDQTLEVYGANGSEVILDIERKKRVKFPRINKNQLVDGARVKAEITLGADGVVDSINILESAPSPEFGQAFERAVKSWTFKPQDSTPSETIPPFEYGMTFFVRRR